MTGATCQTWPEKLRSVPIGSDAGGHAGTNEGEVLLRKLGPHFHLAAFRDAEERARSRPDDLPDLDVAGEDEAALRSADVQPADFGAGGVQLRLVHAHLSIRGVAGRALGIDFRLGDEAAALKRDGALVIVLGELGIRTRR